MEEGEIFGFLGPNGAGKTTTIKMLLGIIYPSAGEGYVLGKEIGDMEVHKMISYLPERPYYYEHMTGPELLKFYGALFGVTERPNSTLCWTAWASGETRRRRSTNIPRVCSSGSVWPRAC